MSRWRELPATLVDGERRLLVQLRRLKDHSGLSFAALASRTDYSRSSWERYLNGKKPVPADAVEQLARVCGVDPTRLTVLQQVAAREAASARPGPSPAPPPPSPAAPDPAGRTARAVSVGRAVAVAVAAAVVAFGAGVLAARAWDDGHRTEAGHPLAASTGYLRGQTYRCDVRRTGGELRAGHSDTREMLLDTNSTGFDVVETQCLLREHGFDPKTTDGLYDERTKAAARAFQAARGLVADGIVGPDTWRELRR